MNLLKTIHEPDCTFKCRSFSHAEEIISAITKGGTEEEEVVISYMQWLCENYAQLTDKLGRTALHIASSCGKGKIVRWLLASKSSKGHVRDWESGWTPLHRSLYYGQLYTSCILLENGASLSTTDHDFMTPINLVMKDRPAYVEYRTAGINEVYVWGTNHNYNLGLGTQQSRAFPESLDTFRRENINIEQVILKKFHTLFLSRGGQVYVCGHGHRGRLGLPVEKTVLKPQLLRSISKEVCVQIAAGTDHSVFLMESGSVWSCGSNEYHQLGHVPPPEHLITPKIISGIKDAKNIVGICAERFHTVICTRDLIYTFGLNAGQLGHPDQGDRLQTAPRIVSSLSRQKHEFCHVASSHAATVCITKAGEMFVLHDYQCKRIITKRTDVVKLIVSGGSLDSKICPTVIKDGGGTELQIVMLTKQGKILVWTESCPRLSNCMFSINRSLHVVDVELFNTGVILATEDGEGFTASIFPPKTKKQETHSEPVRMKPTTASNFTEWIDRDECFQLKMKRLANVHRAVKVSCDHKGRNFAILQAHPKANLLQVPFTSESTMKADLKNLYLETAVEDGVQDCILKIGKIEIPAHRFILASRSKHLAEMIPKSNNILILDKIHPVVLRDVVEFLYTDSCKWLRHDEVVMAQEILNNKSSSKRTSSDKSAANTLKLLKDASRKLKLDNLEKRLEGVAIIDGKIKMTFPKPFATMMFERNKMPDIYDINITCSDGTIIKCHKCILVARSDYFRGMLAGSGWRESSSCISIPISGEIMDIVIDCLYTDKAQKLTATDDVEFTCNVLVTADRLLLTMLKELCEIKLADLCKIHDLTY